MYCDQAIVLDFVFPLCFPEVSHGLEREEEHFPCSSFFIHMTESKLLLKQQVYDIIMNLVRLCNLISAEKKEHTDTQA